MQVHPVDAGVIRCICGFDHDDKFTIQCERCNVWQHAVCVEIFDESSVPDVYFCDQCGGHQHDVQAAIERQLRVLRKRRKSRKPHTEQGDNQGQNQVAGSGTGEGSNGSATSSASRNRRARKKHPGALGDETDSETPIYSSESYFVPSRENIFVGEAAAVVESIASDDPSISQLTVTEFARARPPPLNVARVRPGYGVSAYGLFSSTNIGRDRFVVELCGEILTSEAYKSNPVNQYRLWGTPKPGAFMIPGLSLVLDSRRTGTEAIFLRRSRTPNLRLTPILVGTKLHVMAFATMPVRPETELTIPWDWDPAHPVLKLSGADDADLDRMLTLLDETERRTITATVVQLQSAGLISRLWDCLPSHAGNSAGMEPAGAANAPGSAPGVVLVGDGEGSATGQSASDPSGPSEHLGTLTKPPSSQTTRKRSTLVQIALNRGLLLQASFFKRSPVKSKRSLASTISGDETGGDHAAPVQSFNIWMPAVVMPAPSALPTEPPKKKKLSLADYKKKRPSQLHT